LIQFGRFHGGSSGVLNLDQRLGNVRFGVFGVFEAWHAGAPLHVGRRLERCLLGVLVLEAGREISLDRLTGLLWGEQGPRDPRAALHTYVSRVRAALDRGLDGVEKIAVTWTGRGYRAELDCNAVDALRFRSLLDQARGMADPGPRARLLRSAIALRRGPLLDDVATDAIRQRLAAPWDESWLAAREDAIDAEMACDLHRELLPELMELSAEHPFRERFTASLMRALYRSGRAADALVAYAEAERTMRRGLAITPSAGLQALHAAILRGEPA
jgi:DNA-binding SARP family transcriptional activator